MKQLLILANIFLVIEITLAGSLRVKRNDFMGNDPVVYYKTTKLLVLKFEPLVKNVLADLPPTESYQKARKDLENYLLKAEDTRAKKDICFIKVFKMLEEFIDVLAPFKEANDSTEAKMVLELLNKHGYLDLLQQFNAFVKGYDVEEFGKRVDNLTAADDYQILELC